MRWQVSDGLLYNYFEDKEDLLASALLAHVGGRSLRMASTQADPIGSSEQHKPTAGLPSSAYPLG
jgi:AcrR family transcriptional regulator